MDGHTGFVAGSTGVIKLTADGGISWTDVSAATDEEFRALYFLDYNIGFACTYQGSIWKTTDAGNAWELVYSSADQKTIWSIVMINQSQGWATGADGLILHTTEGGNTWTEQSSGTSYNLRSIVFSGEEMGFVAGDHGTLLRTDNGGESWYPKDLPVQEDLYAIHLLEYPQLIAAGYNGSLLIGSEYMVGIKSEDLFASVKIFPNPTSDQLTIELPDSFKANEGSLCVYSMAGKEIVRQKTTGEKSILDVSNFPNGLYFLQITIGDQNLTSKFIKN
jgi:photosystem II stability/assembly factor-like uncharacterized protein